MKTRRQIILIALLAGMHLCCFAQINGNSNKPAAYNAFNGLYGKPFPAMELEDADGNMFNTGNLHGKTIYMEFWFTACSPCIKQIPFSKLLQQYFAADTNVVFVNICIENLDRKAGWQKMVKEKEMDGIQLFYARNRPQNINLLRQFQINDFPTCILLNNQLEVIGHQAPFPSQKGWVHWAIMQAKTNVSLSEAYNLMANNSAGYKQFLAENQERFATIPTIQY